VNSFLKKSESLEKDPPYIVKLEHFGKTIPFFGKMDNQYMKSIIKYLELPGFYGNISYEEEEKELKNQGKSTYLIRFSNSTVGSFVLTVCSKKGKIDHFKIDSHSQGFSSEIRVRKKDKTETTRFYEHSFETLLVKLLSTLKIKSDPPSRFAWIFSPYQQRDLTDSTKPIYCKEFFF